MIKVSNKKIIAKLSSRSLKAAKLRNIMAVCAIALTSILFTTLFTLGIGSVDAFQQATMRQSGGSGHASLKYIDDDIFDKINTHPIIKEVSYNRFLSDGVENIELLKRRGELWYMDDNGLKHGFCEPTTGNPPTKENEIIMDTKTMQLLNVPKKIGAPVKLLITIRGEKFERDFIISGWWESDPVFNVSLMITSRAYVEANSDELAYTFHEDNSYAGLINAYIMFDNTCNMQGKLDRLITESGYSLVEGDENFIDSNLNWAYLSAGQNDSDINTIVAIIVAVLFIIFTGYLIIYNIFQISVLRDIRYYGLLKTIGTTRKQIKNIILRQAVLLSLIGIPIGLLVGFFVGSKLVPLVLAQSLFGSANIDVSPNPFIFIGAAIFAIITVWLSTQKPGKIAAKVSPVEAVRYNDSATKDIKKEKQSTDGGKLYKMAFSNLGRNKKRTGLVLLSLSLSLVLLNCVFTISRGLDIEKYLSKFVDTDFLVAHADYFNYEYYSGINSVDEEIIKTLEKKPGFEQGGRLYYSMHEYSTITDKSYEKNYNLGHDGNPLAAVYGLDDLPLERLEVLEGEIDMEKLKSGKYILVGVHSDDFGRADLESSRVAVGESVTLNKYRLTNPDTNEKEYITQEYEVMAKVTIKTYVNTNRAWNEYTFFLPSNVYLPLTYEQAVMSYVFNVSDDLEADMEKFLKNYTETDAPLMNYESKAIKVDEFKGMRNLILSVGGILSGIIGLIGILNFTNSMLTSVITRRREFAMLQSIGMTKKQLRNMLCLEGLYYAGGTVIISLILGIVSSIFIVRNLVGGLWFFSYQFVILPLVICWPIFVVIALLVPIISLSATMKESIIERLREIE